MRTSDPQSALEAITWPRLLVSRWPWRSAGYLLTTVLLAVPAFAGVAIPWVVLVARSSAGDNEPTGIVILFLLGITLIGVVAPIISIPLANLERRRLRLVDARPAGIIGRPLPSEGPISSLRARYTDPAAWREVAYVCLLASVGPALAVAALTTVLVMGSFIASPILVAAQRPGDGPVTLPFGDVATIGQTLPYAIGGVLLVPAVVYLLTLVAGVQGAAARSLLLGEPREQLRAKLVEVARSRARLADAFETERRRIERDLHDGAQQRLVSLTLQLGLAQVDLPPDSPAAQPVADAHRQAKQLMGELRELIHGIQPQTLTDLGLPAGLDELASQSHIPVTIDCDLAGRLPSQVENTAYFVAAEALTNIAKHSGATRARVSAHRRDNVLTMEINDDGHGGADPSRGSGLTGLADRVAVAGGRMLLSSSPGGPTLLRVELPCTQNQPESG